MNAHNDSPTGKATIEILNAKNVKYKVNVYAKRGIWLSSDGGYGTVDGLSGPSDEAKYDAEIDVFGYDIESAGKVTAENFETDFVVQDEFGKTIEVTPDQKSKVIESATAEEGQNKHAAHQKSLKNLTEGETVNYRASNKEDKNDRKQRAVNTLVYETANTKGKWGAKGETAGKKAVGTSYAERKTRKK